MSQVIKLKRGGIEGINLTTPSSVQGELLLGTGSFSNGLTGSLFIAETDNKLRLPYTRVDSVNDGAGLATNIGSNAAFDGLLIHSASDNKFYRYDGSTFQELQVSAGSADNVANSLTDGTGIADFTFDGSSAVSISTDDGAIVHDNLSGFEANEHIDHSGVDITAGDGLTGGGDITTSRTLTVLATPGNDTITVASTGISVNTGSIAASATNLVDSNTINSLSSSIASDIATNLGTLDGLAPIGTTTNALTVDNVTLQLNTGTTFNGSGARTISIKDTGVDKDALNTDVAGTGIDGGAGSALSVAAAQTSITSIINSSLGKIGTNASQEYITFGTTNEVNTFVNNTERLSVTSTGVDITGNATVSGDLTVSGTTTFIDTENLNVSSSVIRVNFGGGATKGGIEATDATGGTTVTGSLLWNGTSDYWEAGGAGSEKRIVLFDATNPQDNGFIHLNGSDNVVSVAQGSDGSILMSDGDGTFTVSNVIDGGTF